MNARRAGGLLLGLLAVGAGLAAGVLLRGRPAPAPNLVVLLWDTTRADRLSAYGHSRPTTPWLETLAKRGVLFEQCRAPSSWTLPGHASIFTGLLPRFHGAQALDAPLAPGPPTLAEALGQAGYDTVLVSNNPIVGPLGGLDRGFGTYLSLGDGTRPQTVEATVAALGEVLAARRAAPARAARPLFLFVNLMEPHLPYEPPIPIAQPWLPEGADPEAVRAARAFQFPQDVAHNLGLKPLPAERLPLLAALYDAEIRALDDGCARMEDLLVREGILGPAARPGSLLAVTADHGENLGEHGLVDHKLSVADTLLRVPLVIHAPGAFEGGRRVAAQVRLQDLYPTLLDLAGARPDPARTPHAASLRPIPAADRPQVAELPPPLSFLPEIRRRFPDAPEEALAPFRRGFVTAIGPLEGGRRLRWERSWSLDPSGAVVPLGERLYDLAADPGETRDLLPSDPAAAARLAALADGWLGK